MPGNLRWRNALTAGFLDEEIYCLCAKSGSFWKMLRRGRGRPRKQVCSDGTLTSSQKVVQLRRIGKVLYRKQLNLRRHRILELANANFCSTISKHRRSLRDLKQFARQLGKGSVSSLYPFCQQRASGVSADHRFTSQCGHDHVDWNSSGSGGFASRTAIFEGILRSRQNEDSGLVYDAQVDQWVGVEVILFGRKSSIGVVGSTTSNVCDKLRSVVADPEREQLCASFAKNQKEASNIVPELRTVIANRREEEEGRVWPSATKDGVVPSWLSCKRNITRKRRINASGGISDCHITALIASLPKTWGHIDGKATPTKSIASTEENGLHLCADEGAVIPVDHSSAAVIPVNQSSAAVMSVDRSSDAVIPMEQSFASQESNVNSGQGSSLDFGQEKQVNICVLQRDAIQVCPTTPEKAQKRRRNYQDTIPNHDVRGMDGCEPSNDPSVHSPIGLSDLCPSASACDNSAKDASGPLPLIGDFTLNPYSVDFDSTCNSTGIGEPGLNVAGVELPKSLVNSIPTPAMADPFDSISHVASVISHVILNAVQESSQLFQAQVPSTTVVDMDSNTRKEKCVKFKLNKNFGGTAITSKVKKKYKPRVAKDKPTHKCYGSRLQNKIDGKTVDHGVFKHGRTELVRHHIIKGGVHRGISAKDSCNSSNNFCGNHTNHIGTIGESNSLLYQEDIMGSKIGELTSTPVILISPDEIPSSEDNTFLPKNVLEEDEPSPYPHGSFNLEHDRIVFDSILCTSCRLERRMTSDRFEIGQIKEINNLSSSSEDQMISNLVIKSQKYFEVLSVALSNRVLALLDLPSIGQPHLMYSIAGEVERSPSIQSSDVVRCYTEAALRKYLQATDEDDFSLFNKEWTTSHSVSTEMTALDALSAEMTALDPLSVEIITPDAFNEEAIDFDLFYKELLSAGLEDTLIQSLNVELNEYDFAIADTCSRGSLFMEDQRGVQNLSCKTQRGRKEPDIGGCKQPNSCPSPVRRLLTAQMVFQESVEDRALSSFYASTSAGVNNIMFSRLNKMIEQNIQQNVQYSDKWNKSAEIDLSINVMLDCDKIEVPNTCLEQRFAEEFKDLELSEDYSLGEEDLVIPRDTVLCQLSSQFQNSDPDSNFASESAIMAAEVSNDLEDCSHYILSPNNITLHQTCPRKKICPVKTPFHLMTYVQLVAYIKIILINSLEMSPLQLLRHVQDHLPEEEKIGFEKLWPMILHVVNSEQLQKLADLAKIDLPPCMEVIHDQQMKGQDDRAQEDNQLAPSMEMFEDEQITRCDDGTKEGNHLPPCIEAFQCHQVESWDDEARIDNHLAPSTKMIHNQQIKRHDKGAKEGNHLAPCVEVIQYQQKERRDDEARRDNHLTPCMEVFEYQQIEQQIERWDDRAKEDNHLTDLVPYVGNVENAVVAYDGSFFPLRKRKIRPKVHLDSETIRVWKLLMGKIETTENDYDIDDELKWKEERLIMQEQVETFIQRMHLIQGDRSFSHWKGSVVDSVVGVFLTQNVSDVLSSSAFMCLRARFPGRGFRRPLQSKFPEEEVGEILQNDVHLNPTPIQILQEPQISCFHEVSFNKFASTIFVNGCEEDISNSQESCHARSITSNLEIKQMDTLLSLGSESHGPLTLECQHKGIVLYSQLEQPPKIDTSVIVSAIDLELNVHNITNTKCYENTRTSELEIIQEDTLFLSGSENQGSLTSCLEQGEKIMHSNMSKHNFELSACCITNAECNLTEEVTSSLESQLELLLLQHEMDGANGVFTRNNLTKQLQREEKLSNVNEVFTGLERARLEAQQVHARKSSKWYALAEKYTARSQQAAMDLAPPRSEMTEDGVDWEAVRCAELEEIADAIKERGMNWKLAGRIKGFLERLRLEQGQIDLEWLRSIPSDDAKEFLSSIHGLGLKSVECIRLLTLHHLAFPVDTNVGRICVRLGWVPLEPLPEELQLHVLELYPIQATIQKYLWPRLCTLDQQTLYELHYQLITFGKVFCTKSKPNCNACPMRLDCKHFASALSSAKLALPSSERSLGSGIILVLPPGSCSTTEIGEGPPHPAKTLQSSMCMSQYCQPIIEEPVTPESEADMSDCDIEDYPFFVEEIAHDSMMGLFTQETQAQQEIQQHDNLNRCCKLNFSTTLSELEIVQEMDVANLETLAHEPAQSKVASLSLDSAYMVVDCEGELGNKNVLTRATVLFSDAPSREVVILPPEFASIPIPKLKNIERLRTVHYVYELPDNHPLLDGMDIREADDPCFYLLAIWSPGEVPESIPNINDDNEENGFPSFNFPSDEESIKATLLVPCRTATQGSFPLNGTYFQVNEVFADHASSLQPMLVPRALLWNLRRRYVYFGTSITSILRGMTTEEIQACFWRGYVCVRGFDRMTRAPKPLVGRLHFQATKSISKNASMKNTKT